MKKTTGTVLKGACVLSFSSYLGLFPFANSAILIQRRDNAREVIHSHNTDAVVRDAARQYLEENPLSLRLFDPRYIVPVLPYEPEIRLRTN